MWPIKTMPKSASVTGGRPNNKNKRIHSRRRSPQGGSSISLQPHTSHLESPK